MSWNPLAVVRRLPAPVVAAAIAIIVTRFFNLLMFMMQPVHGEQSGLLSRLSVLPGYRLVFSYLLALLLAEIIGGALLLSGKPSGRTMFIVCQCLMMIMAGAVAWQDNAGLQGIDIADAHQLSLHLLLQKIPDFLILLMLFLPASSRHFFSRPPQKMK